MWIEGFSDPGRALCLRTEIVVNRLRRQVVRLLRGTQSTRINWLPQQSTQIQLVSQSLIHATLLVDAQMVGVVLLPLMLSEARVLQKAQNAFNSFLLTFSLLNVLTRVWS